MKNKKTTFKQITIVFALCLIVGCGSVAFAKTGYFKRSGITAKATLVGSGKTGGAVTAITDGDIVNTFAQVVACKKDGTYLGGNAKTQAAYVEVMYTHSKNNHKKFRGVHTLKDSGNRPYGQYYSHYVNK